MNRPAAARRRTGAPAPAVVAAMGAALAACEPIEFVALPVVEERPAAAIAFETSHDELLTARLGIRFRDWAPPGSPPRVRLDETELIPDEHDAPDGRTIYQHVWPVDPIQADAFPLTLLIPPPASSADTAHLALPLAGVVRQTPHTICVGDEDPSLDYRVLGELPEQRQWSLSVDDDGNYLRRTGRDTLPDPPVIIPRDLILNGDSATAVLIIHAWELLQTEPEIGMVVTHVLQWRLVPPDPDGSCAG